MNSGIGMEIFVVILFLSLTVRIWQHFSDKKRILIDCTMRGEIVRNIEWLPFEGIGGRRGRHYRVAYSKDGHSYRAVANVVLAADIMYSKEERV